LSDDPSCFELSLVSQQSKPSLVDALVVPMQSSSSTTLLLGIDASLDHVVSHSIQPMVEEVVMSIQSSVDPNILLESDNSKEVTLFMPSLANPTLLLGGDASFNHVLRISSYVPSEQGGIPLSLSTIPPSPRMVSFDWNDLVEPQPPSSTPFQMMGVHRYIVDEGSSISILSSSAW
jgi:hypothetical protein